MSTTAHDCSAGVGQEPTPDRACARARVTDGGTRREKVETPEYLAMLGRMIDALVRRVGDGDPEDLAAMIALHDRFGEQLGDAARLQRAQLGYSWGDLAKACDRHRSTLHARFAKAPADV